MCIRDSPNVIAMLNGHYHGASLNFVGFDDDGDGVEERVVYRICTCLLYTSYMDPAALP